MYHRKYPSVKKRADSGSGALMIEGMVVFIITMLLLIWILGIGFVYYQKSLCTITTNDVTAKIASCYYNLDSDIVTGYVETESLPTRPLYRVFDHDNYQDINEERAAAYVSYQMTRLNFMGTVDDVTVTLNFVDDSVLRKHIEITTRVTFNTPFLSQVNLFGTKGRLTYEVTSRAEVSDFSDYMSSADFIKTQTSGDALNSTTLKMINSMIQLYNHTLGGTE